MDLISVFCALLVFTSCSESLPNHPHLCSGEWDCTGNFMTCRDNHCVCDEDEEKRVEPLLSSLSMPLDEDHLCRGVALVGHHCDNLTHICNSNSFCHLEERICQCNPGFEEYSQASECRLGWGQSCDDKGKLCNPEKMLSCSSPENGTCSCVSGDLTYDFQQATCVAPVGGQCELSKWLGIQLSCGTNVACIKEDDGNPHYGVCQCVPGFYSESGSHQCIPIFGKVCNSISSDSTEDCGGHEDYFCEDTDKNNPNHKVCRCKTGLVYDVDSKNSIGCKLRVGQNCLNFKSPSTPSVNSSSEQSCVSNAHCSPDNSMTTGSGSVTCQCLEDFLPTSDGRCQLGLGATNCSNSSLCHQESGLVCLKNDTCGCPEGFIFSQGRCLGTHGTECDDSTSCVQYSDCDPIHNVCFCRDTFVVSEIDGSCHHGFGSPCDLTRSDQCLTLLGMECQKSQSLPNNSSFDTETCTCIPESGTIYDAMTGKCLLKVGESCDYLNPELKSRRCIKRAFCGMRDKCQCYNGYSATPEGDCLVSYGFICSEDEDVSNGDFGVAKIISNCNHFQGLTCVLNKCECGFGQLYNESRDECEIEGILPISSNVSREPSKSESPSSQYYSHSSTAMPLPSVASYYWLTGFALFGTLLLCSFLVYSVRKVVK